ncbi:transposable element Tcb1 transposase [Trichonephila clavipes]|uniref:Transposable element Tcb1 transposase n=1 Tax=Trichonephila clavipes TaxID=2585209 RepID=A0A8X6UYT8_TRICX|nr:transposable element Tcb1 transposase [Trichonephila clavipes]
MPLRRFRRQYEHLSQFERGRIIGNMEARWLARRVARQIGRSDCVVISDSKKCHLHEDQAQDVLDRSVVEKTTTSSDDNPVHVWRSCVERLNPVYALQRYTVPTAGVMV